MLRRMLGAARLDVNVYEEVEADQSATMQAFMVVAMVAVASGVGLLSVQGVSGLIVGVIFGVVGWALWALITMWIGTTLLRTPETEADWGQLLRTLGFAQSPGILRVFGFIPVVGPVIFAVTSIWLLVTMVIAVRQALDYSSTLRAIGVVLIGFIPYVVLFSLIIILFP
ncbi:MAG: YIP1 family protein [Chloroflexi bacterium]|nr:YIP1 family protein [Chloroflexota bacterium]